MSPLCEDGLVCSEKALRPVCCATLAPAALHQRALQEPQESGPYLIGDYSILPKEELHGSLQVTAHRLVYLDLQHSQNHGPYTGSALYFGILDHYLKGILEVQVFPWPVETSRCGTRRAPSLELSSLSLGSWIWSGGTALLIAAL